MMNVDHIHGLLQRTLNGEMTFPAFVGGLMEERVESYQFDLVRAEDRFYSLDGESSVESVVAVWDTVAMEFSAQGVQAAIKASQRGEIKFAEFLKLAAEAGVTHYSVFLQGRKAIYFGRNGDFHVEPFPQ